MKKYLVVYYASESFLKQMENASPEESKKGMELWMAWAEKCGSGLLDLGAPLASGVKITKAGVSSSNKNVVGYSILQAEDMEKAKSMLKEHPHLYTDSCEIEVYEAMPLPG